MNTILDDFSDFYRDLENSPLTRLPAIYSDNIEFCDPVHCIHGIDVLSRYFEALMQNVQGCRFDIHQVNPLNDIAYVHWTMIYRHPRLNRGVEISLPGISYLEFDERIRYQRDYYDLGGMLYEHLPLLGTLVRAVKQRLVHE